MKTAKIPSFHYQTDYCLIKESTDASIGNFIDIEKYERDAGRKRGHGE